MLQTGSCLVVWACLSLATGSYVSGSAGGAPLDLPDAFLREMVARMGSGLADSSRDYLDLPPRGLEAQLAEGMSPRAMKEMPAPPMALDYDDISLSPSLRDQEYLSHSSLLSSVLGNYEGKMKQRPKPSSSGVKSNSGSDGVLPAYCNPPNPCPLGYTGADGCLEDFENTAGFSRDYQALQDCMCDTEHMFECADSTRDSEITALARSIQNEGVLDSTLDKIMSGLSYNPYLQGEKLPVAAKKGGRL
ncbi:uncharacterized protein LOC121878928 isoform X2 [Homarus americanus]|uniref:Neuroendocrine protein 7B2 n=1 Tax=Homarus americanus TaxID=6706 RepID=A0A8J5MP45_HOMAM|nr:uncharacterized protein LOC121878928 isoform X2 [Homarus americanus]KAG7158227.1 Neuroendocrine protein 7B2-like [Homarus americanus]